MESTLASPAAGSAEHRARPLQLSNLLLLVAGLVFAMVVVGGITRLTESGLSITEWKPLSGAIPPLSHADWVRAFDFTKRRPNTGRSTGPAGMTLAQFKHIYWWECVHRLLGRLIGLVFAARPRLVRGEARDSPGLWLEDGRAARARRSAGRCSAGTWSCRACRSAPTSAISASSAHLLLALAIMGALIWVALDLRRLAATGEDRPSRLTSPALRPSRSCSSS